MNTNLRTEPAVLAAFAQQIRESTGRVPFHSPMSAASSEAMSTGAVMLRARSWRWLRKVLAISWSGYLIASNWWAPNSKLVACLLAVAVLGTYRETLISKSKVTWKLWMAFLPVRTRTQTLQDAQCVCSEWEEQGGMIEALMLGSWGLLFAPLSDWLCPWPGGVYKLWIKSQQGTKVLVWRGRSERNFHSNHRLMQSVTGLPSPRDLMNLSS
jgi:hypothetical protein